MRLIVSSSLAPWIGRRFRVSLFKELQDEAILANIALSGAGIRGIQLQMIAMFTSIILKMVNLVNCQVLLFENYHRGYLNVCTYINR